MDQRGKFTMEHLEKIQVGILLFNQGKFWECHEELEHHWLEDRGDNARYVYWAVIQVAAALYHVHSNNIEGAKELINKAKAKFRFCEENLVETDLLRTKLQWDEFKRLSFNVPDRPELKDFSSLLNFKFYEYSLNK